MKLRVLSLITLLAVLLGCMTACLNSYDNPNQNINLPDSNTTSTETESESDSAKTPVDINVYTLNGTTGFGFAKMMNDAKNGAFETENYTFTVQSDASVITSALINGDVDIAALPTNAAANLYNVTEGGVKILAVNTLGCLYLLTKEGTTVETLADLKGKTVYTPQQNPSFIVRELVEKNGLTVGTGADAVDIDSSSYKLPADLRDAVASGTVDIAVLPEPMVTIAIASAKQNNVTVTNAMDLTKEWDKVHTEGSLVQGCVVVRKAFLDAYPEAVENFLTAYEASINYLTANVEETAQMIADNGIFANANVAKKAIPNCNVCYLDGAAMKTAMEEYLNVLYTIKAQSIGGKLPEADFYYNAQ